MNVLAFPAKEDGLQYRCSSCFMTVDAPCKCGAQPELIHPGEAVRRAMVLPENQTKSNRLLAADLGVSEITVRRAKGDADATFVAQAPPTATERIVKALEENPEAKTSEIAAIAGVNRESVKRVKRNGTTAYYPPNGRKPKESDEEVNGRRLEQFRRQIGILVSTCTGAQGIEIPDLSAEDTQDAIDEIKAASAVLRKLLISLNDMLRSQKEGTRS